MYMYVGVMYCRMHSIKFKLSTNNVIRLLVISCTQRIQRLLVCTMGHNLEMTTLGIVLELIHTVCMCVCVFRERQEGKEGWDHCIIISLFCKICRNILWMCTVDECFTFLKQSLSFRQFNNSVLNPLQGLYDLSFISSSSTAAIVNE